jgi:hypothetical protein
MTAANPIQAPINPRWVLTTLRQRGMPEPPLTALAEAIATLDPASTADFRGRVSRLHAGGDRDEDMGWLTRWCAPLLRQRDDQSARAPAANDQDEPGSSEPRAVPPSRESRRGQSFEPSHHVYGAKAALCLECVRVEPTPGGKGTDGYSTIQLEMAPALRRNTYDWDRKIIFRLTQREVALFAAVLLGWCKKLELKGHGPANDKILEIADQGANLFIKLRQGRTAHALPLGGDEIFPVTSMALKALGLNAPHLDSQTLVQLAKRAGDMYGRATAAPGEGQ